MVSDFLAIFEKEDPKSVKSILNARNEDPKLFDLLADRILSSMVKAFPERTLSDFAQAYSIYTFEQNRMQARYERSGKYSFESHAAADQAVYQNSEVMTDYMSSLLLTQFLWPHHLKIIRFFREKFIPLLPNDSKILELAPGHGFFGRMVLENKPEARLLGIDISPRAIEMAQRLAATEPCGTRAEYRQGDALAPTQFLPDCNVIIAGELLEHLDKPQLLIGAISNQIKGGYAFITAAITAAAADHVYEFKSQEEVFALFNGSPLKLVDSLCVFPPTVRPGTDRVPRVLAMIVKK